MPLPKSDYYIHLGILFNESYKLEPIISVMNKNYYCYYFFIFIFIFFLNKKIYYVANSFFNLLTTKPTKNVPPYNNKNHKYI